MFTVFPSQLVGTREIIGKSGEVSNPELVSGSEIPKQVRNKIGTIPALSRNCEGWSTVISQ